MDIAATTPLTAASRCDRLTEGEETASSLLNPVVAVSVREVTTGFASEDPKLLRAALGSGGFGVTNARGEGAHANAASPRARASSLRAAAAAADSPLCPDIKDSIDQRSGEVTTAESATNGRLGGRETLRRGGPPPAVSPPRSSSRGVARDIAPRSFDSVSRREGLRNTFAPLRSRGSPAPTPNLRTITTAQSARSNPAASGAPTRSHIDATSVEAATTTGAIGGG